MWIPQSHIRTHYNQHGRNLCMTINTKSNLTSIEYKRLHTKENKYFTVFYLTTALIYSAIRITV